MSIAAPWLQTGPFKKWPPSLPLAPCPAWTTQEAGAEDLGSAQRPANLELWRHNGTPCRDKVSRTQKPKTNTPPLAICMWIVTVLKYYEDIYVFWLLKKYYSINILCEANWYIFLQIWTWRLSSLVLSYLILSDPACSFHSDCILWLNYSSSKITSTQCCFCPRPRPGVLQS